jgi:hypothetical protein
MPTFYRIVKTNPPTEAAFLSHEARGLPLRGDTAAMRRSWERVSMYDTLERTQAIARRFPAIGAFIPELSVELGGSVAFERSGDDPWHFDLDATPDDLLAAVTRVLPV